MGLGDRRRAAGSQCRQPSSCRVGPSRCSADRLLPRTRLPLLPGLGRPLGPPSGQALRLSGAVDARGLWQVGGRGESRGKGPALAVVPAGQLGGRLSRPPKNSCPLSSGGFLAWPKQSSVAGPPAEAGRVTCTWQRPPGRPGGQSVLQSELWPPPPPGHPSPAGMSQERQCFCTGGIWARAPHPKPSCEQCRWVL